MAMGLYDVSRRREQGLVPSLGHSITCWDQRIKTLGMLLLVFSFWAYSIAATLHRVRSIILEREKDAEWVARLPETA